MTDEPAATAGEATGDEPRSLPRHLAALMGALEGPRDLGANHDAYLSFPSRDGDSGGAESA
jgi:hypothetical protein